MHMQLNIFSFHIHIVNSDIQYINISYSRISQRGFCQTLVFSVKLFLFFFFLFLVKLFLIWGS